MSDPKSPSDPISAWSYSEAFSRHRGLIDIQEQERLRSSRVAVVGLGGVGGIHLVTLARLGIGAFNIADPDRFETANFNRQFGATTRALGRLKAEVLAEEAWAINPDLDLRVFTEPVTAENVDPLLQGVDVVVDGIDFFALAARRLVFAEARRRGVWAVTAAPLGFSTAWLCFSPTGMSFDEYFDIGSTADPMEQLVSFLQGLAPRATHRGYLDFAQVNPATGRGPSVGLACQLCAGVAAAEVVKIVLGRGDVRAAPWSFQFDAYRRRMVSTRLVGGNGTWTWTRRRLRRRLRGRLERMGWRPPEARTGSAVLYELLRAAAQAPSGDNTQPWRFQVDAAAVKVTVFAEQSRDPSPMNVGGRMARIAVGAAVENILVAANERGLAAELESLDAGGHAVRVCVKGKPRPFPEAGSVVFARTTNRLPYDGKPVPAETLERLRSAPLGGSAAATCWITGRDRLAPVAELIGRADGILFGVPAVRRAFLGQVRFGGQRSREDGLPAGSLGVPKVEQAALRALQWVPDWLFRLSRGAELFAAKAATLVRSASGLCVVAANDDTPETDLEVGRAMERAWLLLTAEGLQAQPMMSLPVLENAARCGYPAFAAPRTRAAIEAVVAEFRTLVPELERGRVGFLLRFGYGPLPQERARRLPLEKVTAWRSNPDGLSADLSTTDAREGA